MCGYALRAYSLGLIGFSLVKVLAPGYFARQDTKTPVKVGIIALSVNMGFNLMVVVPAHLAGFPVPHALLALSTGMSAFVNATLLYLGLRRQGVFVPSAQWRRLLPQVLFGCLAMAAFLWWYSGDWSAWNGLRPAEKAWRMGLAVAGGAAVYFAALGATGLRPRHLKSL
jgi:putative peptidoglycan lipid II flippase